MRKLIIICGLLNSIIIPLMIGCTKVEVERQPIKIAKENPTVEAKSTPIPTQSVVAETTTESLEYKLACINKGFSVDKDDITVNRFRYLLTTLETKTENTRQQIGDMTVKSQEIMKEKYGKNISLLELMEQANKAIPDNANHTFKYEEIISLVIILLSK